MATGLPKQQLAWKQPLVRAVGRNHGATGLQLTRCNEGSVDGARKNKKNKKKTHRVPAIVLA